MDRRKIYFIAGMPRAGTTFLYHTLALHPSLFVPSRKETDFFSINYPRGLDWYLNFFERMTERKVAFDISPLYFMDKRALERIQAFNRNARILLIIRNPVEWSISYYGHEQAKWLRKFTFANFLEGYVYRKDSKSLLLEFKGQRISSSIDAFRHVCGHNLLLCDYNVLRKYPLRLLKAIEKFAGTECYFSNENFRNVIINSSEHEPPVLINILMRQKLFADMVTRMVPKKLIMAVRYSLQKSRRTLRKKVRDGARYDENTKLAEEVFARDIEYISSLFQDCGIILGDGTRFEN